MEFFNRTLFTLNDRAITPSDFLWALVAFALVMGLALLAAGMMRKRLFARGHGNPSTEGSLVKAWLVLAGLLGFMLALWVIGFRPGSALLALGLLAVAVALAARHALANCISGLVLLYERSLTVGDHVQIGSEAGEIEAIRLRSTYVRTRSGARLVVPNVLLMRTAVTNLSAPDGRIRLTLPVTLDHGSDTNDAIMLLRKVAERNARVRKNPQPRAFLTAIEPVGMQFELWAWVNDPSDAPYVQNELLRGIQSEFERARIRFAGAEGGRVRAGGSPVRRPSIEQDPEPVTGPGEEPVATTSRESSGDGENAPRRGRTRMRRSRRGEEAHSSAPRNSGNDGEAGAESRRAERARPEPPAVQEPEFTFEPEPEPEAEPDPPTPVAAPITTATDPEPEVAEPAPVSSLSESAHDDGSEESPKSQTFGRSKRKVPRR